MTLIFDRHGVSHHLSADDKQAYADAPLSDVDDVRGRLHDCTADLFRWCASRRLQLNEVKTELAWFGKPSRLASMDRSVAVSSSTINPSSAVKDLGVILDAELTMKPQIARVTLLPTTQIEARASLSELSQRLVRYCSVEDATLEGAVCCR